MCFVVRLISVELVEELERQGARWSPRQWEQAAMLSSVILRQVLRDVVCRKPLERFYEARTPFGSIAASAVETRDIIKLRVYHLSFTTRPFRPRRHLHRLLGRAFTRETFVLYGVRRSLDLMPGIQVPWRHVPRSVSGENGIHVVTSETIDFATTNIRASHYPAHAALTSDAAKTWTPNGSHDSSLRDRMLNLQLETSFIEHDANGYFARLQPSGSPGETANGNGARTADDGIKNHEDFNDEAHDFDSDSSETSKPAGSRIIDVSPTHQPAFLTPLWMHALSPSLHDTARTHGPVGVSSRPHGSTHAH